MWAIRWLWEGSPWVNGLILGSALVALNFGLGVHIHPCLFIATISVAALLCMAANFVFQGVRFALMTPDHRRRRLRMFQTNYGRGGGWYVEREGRQFALLTDPRFEEMFWDSYAVAPLTDDPAERERIASDPSWWHQPGLEFRSREFGIVAPTAFAAGSVFSEPGRVSMRALYLYIGPPTMWERFWLRYLLEQRPSEPDVTADRPRQ